MSKLNLINVSSADASLDNKKANKADVTAQFAKVELASAANSAIGSLNGKVDTNSASEAKSFTAVNGSVTALSTSANTNYTKLSGVINNLDVTNDKINALRNLMHADGENLPKLMAMATSYEGEISSNSAASSSLASAKEDKADAANSFTSLQSSASNHADSVANSVANSAKGAIKAVQTSASAINSKADSNAGKINSLATANASLQDDVTQLISALSAK